MSSTPPSRHPKRERKKQGRQARRAAEIAALRRQQRNRRMVRFGLLAVVVVAALVAVQAFGGDDGDDDDLAADQTETTETTATDDTTETTAANEAVGPPTCEGPSGDNTDMASKPTVEVPEEPATELTCQDFVVGDGAEVTSPTDTVRVHYVGVGQQTKEEFDASWDGEPVEFPLDGVIQGWTEGIVGMKVGGRRLLVIPGDKAYGEAGRPGIEPNETLVFVVDLLEVKPAG